ncbi:hypothetical protein FCM35_KLT00069 [Carex littledalei]|uniref:30S ribosomal protein S31, mitochondrial n=1 Tax=Carex littledalei TaxID=544730 RepID=A0A833RLV7_9POAL|nr:hypothetical protein FCM35_KLT00069 [Carex littledalei]
MAMAMRWLAHRLMLRLFSTPRASPSRSSSTLGATREMVTCGRGNKKTKRGKLFKGYGNARPKKDKKIDRINVCVEVPICTSGLSSSSSRFESYGVPHASSGECFLFSVLIYFHLNYTKICTESLSSSS